MIQSIVFCGGLLPAQLGIQAATLSRYSHCYALLEDGQIIDSTFRHGVSLREELEIDSMWSVEIPVDGWLTITQNVRLEYWLRCEIGKKYDFGYFFGYPFSRKWKDDDSWVCSELIGAGLAHVGALTIPKMHRLSPRNLLRRIDEMVMLTSTGI